jgi:hypothetical protein
MRKGALLLALVFAVSAPTLASAAKKRAAAPADPAVAAQKNSASFMQDALHQIIVPLESLSAPQPAPKAKRAKKKK